MAQSRRVWTYLLKAGALLLIVLAAGIFLTKPSRYAIEVEGTPGRHVEIVCRADGQEQRVTVTVPGRHDFLAREATFEVQRLDGSPGEILSVALLRENQRYASSGTKTGVIGAVSPAGVSLNALPARP